MRPQRIPRPENAASRPLDAHTPVVASTAAAVTRRAAIGSASRQFARCRERRRATMAAETVPYGRVTQKAPAVSRGPHSLDHRRPGLRRRLGFDHRRHAAEHRRRRPGRDSRPAQSAPAQPGARLRDRRRLHEVLVSWPRRASSIRSCWWSKARSPTRRSRRKATGRRWAPIRRPASRSPPTSGSTAWRRRRWRSWRCGTCATYGGIHAMAGNPTGCMGLADYLGWDWRSKAGLPIVNVPGCPVQPDNFMETLLYLLYQVAGLAPMIPLDDAAAADLAVRQDRARRLRPRRLLRAGRLRRRSTARRSAS